jgi:hypothetical protein
MTYASVAASANVDVYANWAEIMVRMTCGSVRLRFSVCLSMKLNFIPDP